MTAPLYAVIMAGGSGTRFWPLSRGARPKQLVRIVGETTMIQATVARLQPLIPAERVLVITTAAIAEETRRQLPMLPAANVIAEPVGRDTAACVSLAAEILHRLDPAAIMALLPADQVISPADAFQLTLAAAAAVAAEGRLVTCGVEPRFPATGYGYIRLGEALPSQQKIGVHLVDRFVEKPDLATAESWLASGGYRWNAGIFVWQVETVRRELATHVPWLVEALAPVGAAFGSSDFDRLLAEAYGPLRKISIDYALMERATGIAVVDCPFVWDDVGSWDALYDHADADAAGLRARGDVVAQDCTNSLLVNDGGPLIAAIGVDGLTVVSTADAVLVVPRGRSQEVKALYEQLKAGERGELL